MAKYPAEPLLTPTVNDLAWLAGTWVGERRGEAIEEHWSEPAAGAIMGMFRWLRQEKGVLYEFMTLEPGENGGVVLRIKHFNAGLVGWEEKDQSTVFALVAHEADNYVFRHPKQDASPLYLVYQPIEEGGLLVYFDSDDATPDPESGFRYVRQPL
jgi:hypothetical protein